MTEQLISLERVEEIANLFGSFDENIRLLEQELGVQVTNRDGALKVAGEAENVMLGVKAIEALLELSGKGEQINEQNVRYVLQLVRSGSEAKLSELAKDVICAHRQRQAHQGQDRGSEGLCGCHQEKRHHAGGRPRRHRQDLSGCGCRPWPPSGPRRSTASS